MGTRASVAQTGLRTSFWRRPLLGFGLLLVVGLALAGCGGDDGRATTGSSGVTTEEPPTTDAACCGPPGFTIDGVTYFSLELLTGSGVAGARGDKVATLDDGQTIYEIPGEQPWFRVADESGFVFQGSGRPDATTGGEVVDLTGVDTIRVVEWRTSLPVATITDPARVASLVASVTSGSLRGSAWGVAECQVEFEAPGRETVQMFVEPSTGVVWTPHPERRVGISVGTAFENVCPPSDASG